MNTYYRKWSWLLVAGLLVISLGTTSQLAKTSSAPPHGEQPDVAIQSPDAPADTPQTVVAEPQKDFVVTSGLLYWSEYGDIYTSVDDTYLRRKPTQGGSTATLFSLLGTTEHMNFLYMAGDDTGIYYYNHDDYQIEFRPVGDPYDPPTVLASGLSSGAYPVAKLDLDNSYVYWASFDDRILRVPKAGGTVVTLANTSAGLRDVEPSNLYIHWLDNDGLWKISKSCSPLPCGDKTHASTVTGHGLRYVPNLPEFLDYTVYFIEMSTPQKIRRYSCVSFPISSCGLGTTYTAPTEQYVELSRPAFGNCPTAGHRCLYWKEMDEEPVKRLEIIPDLPRLRRFDLDSFSISPETIAINLDNRDGVVETDEHGVYFQMNNDYLGFLPFSASAITRDLVAEGLEVTQGIQDMANSVPLVANKPTYVRAYGSNAAGPQANNVQATLSVKVNNTLLETLYPLDGDELLKVGDTYDRGVAADGWLFRIPWTLDQIQETVTLELNVDPLDLYDDPNRANNRTSVDVKFEIRPPACTIFIPVRTHAPKAKTSLPNFNDMIDLYKRLWPVQDVWVYSQSSDIAETEVCWKWGFIPYPCFGPYELDEGWSIIPPFMPDKDKAMASLFTRWLISDDPDECDELGSAVHYVGMVHPDTYMGDHDGYASYYTPVSYVKLPPASGKSDSFTWPWAGSSLAHEITHNYDRRHVDCGDPDDVVNDYPYENDCWLDDLGPDKHYGFDINQLVPIRPDQAADYMSYSLTTWVSDYTYEAVFYALTPPLVPAAAEPAAAVSGDQVLVSGVVDPTEDHGYLGYAWVYPETSLTTGIAEKFHSLAAPAFNPRFLLSPDENYHLRLLDAGGATLADHTLTLQQNETLTGISPTYSFAATLPAPTGQVVKIELLRDSTVLASLTPGSGLPNLKILQPAGGETFDDSITISWQASDPDPDDRLLFNIQYSPDGGTTWRAVTTDFPGTVGSTTTTLSLSDLAGMPGSSGQNGLLRIAASDGYNTTLSQSLPFEISDQPPQVYITSPNPAFSYRAGEVIPLRGGATDPEEGGIDEENLDWQLDGQYYGFGTELFASGLAPGSYSLSLQAEDSQGNTSSAQSSLEIERLGLPLSTASPTLDGNCNDSAYNSVSLGLAPYDDGPQGSIHLLRTSTYLYACFSNLQRSADDHISQAGLWVDVDFSQDDQAQSDDYGFFVGEDGGPLVISGATMQVLSTSAATADDLEARVSANATHWNAELKIDADALGGWDHLAGLTAGHFDNTTSGYDYLWPYAADPAQPTSWAETALGDIPEVENLDPQNALAGAAGLTLSVSGSGFTDGDSVLWDDQVRTTTYISATLLEASITAADLSAAGEFEVQVLSAAAQDFTSNALLFTIENPAPHIDSLSPNAAQAESGAFTLQISGSGFMSASTVLWNDEELSTTYKSASSLEAKVPASSLGYGSAVGVTVLNPEPGGGASNTVDFTILPIIAEEYMNIYLPIILQ